jgi:hypothetical protein
MDRTAGLGRLAQLGAMTMSSSGAGVATALAQELFGGGWSDAVARTDGLCPRLGRKPAAPADPDRRGGAPRPPAGRAA